MDGGPEKMSDEMVARYNELNRDGLSLLEAHEVISGKIALPDMLARKAVANAALALAKKPKGKWPRPTMKWDSDQERWHRSMDDHSEESFAATFPDVVLVWVDMDALQGHLSPQSRRTKDPFSKDYRCRSARLVFHLQSGGKVSPPMIRYNQGSLLVVGGNHRLGWAHYLGDTRLPILIQASERPLIENLVSLTGEPA